MTEWVKNLLSELKAALESTYGDHLRGVYLYGSYARGEQDDESDIDVLIVLDRVLRYGDEIERTSHIVSELSLEYGRSISRAFVSQRDWSRGHTPFLANVRAEALQA